MPKGVKCLIIADSHSKHVYPGSSSIIDRCTDIVACASSYEHLYSYTGIPYPSNNNEQFTDVLRSIPRRNYCPCPRMADNNIIPYLILIVFGFFSSGTMRSTKTFSKPFSKLAPTTSIYSPRAKVRVNFLAAIPL